jgi:hypothetical protein
MREVGEIFAVSVWVYAGMSNHLHVVEHTLPGVALRWSSLEVAERWVGLFPRPDPAPEQRAAVSAGHADRIAEPRRPRVSRKEGCLNFPKFPPALARFEKCTR